MQIFLAVVIALLVSLGFGPFIIKKLKEYKIGQQIRHNGPQEHLKKQGTPTMGGFIFMTGIIAAALIMNRLNQDNLLLLLGMVLFGLIGFLDDRLIIKTHSSDGLSAKQKIALNIIFSIGMAYLLNPGLEPYPLYFPVLEKTWMLSPVLYFLFIILFYTAVTNSVNLTDGIDGLCGSVSLVVAIFYIVYASSIADTTAAIFAAAMAGALAGYLFFNWYPARVFMGDTGSFALGGALATLAILTKTEILFILVGIIYVIESLSDIIQIGSKKLRGKRVFLMAPIHHHFEKKGWSEVRIVAVFSLVTTLAAVLAFFIA